MSRGTANVTFTVAHDGTVTKFLLTNNDPKAKPPA